MGADLSLLAKVSEDRALGSALLFQHRHEFVSPPAHVEIMDLWRSADELVLIEASRDFGKSTLSEEFLLLEGCFGNFHYCLLIGETYGKAVQRLEAIAHEAKTNVKLHRLFGGDVLARKPIENRVWFKSGAMIEALGWEQELQSFKQHSHRPDRAYLDDPENLERVRDAASVDASMRKLYLELIPAMDKRRRKIRITQTRRAEDCMVTRLFKNPEWVARAFPLADRDPDDPEARSNWPDRYSIEWIRAEKRRYQEAGMLGEFLQSYMLQTTDPASKPFKDEMLAFMDASPWHWMPKFAIYDPARTSREKAAGGKAKSDRYGKVVVSRLGSKILVHESGGYFWKPDEFMADVFATHEKHSPAKTGIEKNSLDDWLMQPMRIEMMRRGVSLPLVALTAPQDRSKEDFIHGLQPFAEARDIVLVGGRSAHPHLIAEWLNFPQGSRDVMNALAYSLRMFAGEPVYPEFGGQHLTDAHRIARGETVYAGFAANDTEAVVVGILRSGRALTVAFDASATGSQAEKSLAFELRARYPQADFSCWVPAELHDQAQRLPLVTRLRAERLVVQRGEYTASVRGSLSMRLRTEAGAAKRLLMVDRGARLTLNALSVGYARDIERGGRPTKEPAPGTSRLVAEAIECVVSALDRQAEMSEGIPRGANIAVSTGGLPFVSAHPSARRG